MGWSKDGIEFYNEVKKQWRDIAFANNCGIWSDLEGAWAEYAEENNFGNMYSQKNTRHDISSNTPDYDEAQEKELPADHFSVQDEMNDCQNGKRTKHMKTMRMGVTMTMKVVGHGRELGKGTIVRGSSTRVPVIYFFPWWEPFSLKLAKS